MTLHHKPQNWSDRIAYVLVRIARFLADVFFRERYGHRAVVLETVAAVPGIVGALLVHLKSLRWIHDDRGWIRTLEDEAENERMHLMVYVGLVRPSALERCIIWCVQAIFFVSYFVIYFLSPRTGHRIVGYFEEEAIVSYTRFLDAIDAGNIPNVPAPALAIAYWHLAPDATLRDTVLATRADEERHRDTNHLFANEITSGKV